MQLNAWGSSKSVLFHKIKKTKCQKFYLQGLTLDITFYKYVTFFDIENKEIYKFLRLKKRLSKPTAIPSDPSSVIKMKCIGFLDKTIKWFHSYLANRAIFVSLGTVFSELGTMNCGVPQGSILGPLLFLLYINDIPQALSNTHTYLYADETSIFCQHKDVTEIKNVSNKEFANVSNWFVDNKLSIHLGEDKAKCILFSRVKNLPELNITYNKNRIKQYRMVEYLGCCLDANLSGESMAMKSPRKINTKLQFLYRQNEFLNPKLRRLLCNFLIQPHFDYACISWYHLVNQKMSNKLQVTQKKCIRFCLKLNSRQHIGTKKFKKLNLLPTRERVE